MLKKYCHIYVYGHDGTHYLGHLLPDGSIGVAHQLVTISDGFSPFKSPPRRAPLLYQRDVASHPYSLDISVKSFSLSSLQIYVVTVSYSDSGGIIRKGEGDVCKNSSLG